MPFLVEINAETSTIYSENSGMKNFIVLSMIRYLIANMNYNT